MNGKQFIAAGLLILVAIWYLGKRGYGSSAASAPNQPSNPSDPARGCGCDSNSGVMNATAPDNPVSASSRSLSNSLGTPGAAGDLAGSLAPGSNADAPGSGGNWQGLRTRTRGVLTPPDIPASPIAPTSNYVMIAYSNPAMVSA